MHPLSLAIGAEATFVARTIDTESGTWPKPCAAPPSTRHLLCGNLPERVILNDAVWDYAAIPHHRMITRWNGSWPTDDFWRKQG